MIPGDNLFLVATVSLLLGMHQTSAASPAALTPKAFANFSPGFERSENPGIVIKRKTNPERVRQLPNPFRVQSYFFHRVPGLSLRSNPGLSLANAFGVRPWRDTVVQTDE